ncbi:MAG: hypothetical protein ABH842_06350 [Candidatus Micrarchaeota archaeon]
MNGGKTLRGLDAREVASLNALVERRFTKVEGAIGIDHKRNQALAIYRMAVSLLPNLNANESGPLRNAIVRFARSSKKELTEDSWNIVNRLAIVLAHTYVATIKRHGKEVPVGIGGKAILAEVATWENAGTQELTRRLEDLDSYHQFLSREALTYRREQIRIEAESLAEIVRELPVPLIDEPDLGRMKVTDDRSMARMEIALVKNYAILLSSYLTRDLEQDQRDQINILLVRFERMMSSITNNRVKRRTLEEIGILRTEMRELVDGINAVSTIKNALREAEDAHQIILEEIGRYDGGYRRIDEMLLTRIEYVVVERDAVGDDPGKQQELASRERTLTTEYSLLVQLRDKLPEVAFDIEGRIEELNRLIGMLGNEGSRYQKTDRIALAIIHLEEAITNGYVVVLQAAHMRLRNRTIHNVDEFVMMMELDSAAYERIRVYSEQKVNVIDPNFRESLRELYGRMNAIGTS